jgi:hypothetical protein
MASRTPTKVKKKAIAPCENVELEFTQRFLSLFTSFYYTPSTEEIATFPPAPPDPLGTPKDRPVKIPPFHSGVWDLRLKKAVEARLTNDTQTSDSLTEQANQLRENLSAETPQLGEIFMPRKAERPEVPVYIKMLEQDEKDSKVTVKAKPRPHIDSNPDLAKLFTKKLAEQKAASKERVKRRFQKAKRMEEEHLEFVSHLHKFPIQQDDWQPRTVRKEQEDDRTGSLIRRNQNRSPNVPRQRDGH